MKHILELRHKMHLADVGIIGDLKHVHADDEAYEKAKDHWKATMPGASEDELHVKALANIAWKQQNAPVAPQVETPTFTVNLKPLLKPLWMCVGLLGLLVLLSVDAHCQFSHVNTISATDGTHTVFSASPFSISFSGCTVGGTGSAWTISCTGGAANPGGSAHQLQVNLSGTGFAGIANGTAGQVLCSNGTSSDPAMCDPVVSGPDAPGVAPTKPPVQVGLFDGTNVQRILGSSAGRLSVDVNSAPTTAVTGTFWQATQPVSGTFWQATQPVSGTFWQATQPISGSVTVTQATGTNLHTVCDSGCSSSTAPADASAFTESTTSFSPIGGYFRTSPTSLTTDHMGTVGMTATRHLFVNLPDALPAGTNVIGHVIADSGSTTAVTGNVAATVADGADVTLGAKADAKSTATDTTAITAMQVLKEISAMEQAPASRAVTNTGTFAVQATLSAETTKVIGTVNVAAGQTIAVTNTTASNLNAQVVGAGADGAATSGNPVLLAGKGSGNARVPIVCDNWKPFSLASTTALKLVTLSSNKQVYICSINIVSAGANNIALIEGTKVTNDCDTATAGMAGGTTAATGWNFAANGGLSQGTGIGVIAATATVSHDVCLLASASTQVSGVISWTQF